MNGSVLDVERAWYRSLCRLPEATNGVSLLVRVTLKGCVVARDLDLELMQLGGEWMPGRAWCPAIDSAVHRTVSNDLVLTGDPTSGTLVGAVSVDLAWGPEWHMLLDGADSLVKRYPAIPASVRVKLRITQGTVRGDFTVVPKPFPAGTSPPNPLPRRQGTVSGTIAAVREAPLPWRTAPPAIWRTQSPDDLYLAACGLENQAGRMYRDVRATEIAGMLGVPFREAFGQTLSQSVRRAPLGGPAPAAGRPGGKKKPEDVPDLLGEDMLDLPGDDGGDAGGEAAKDDSSPVVLAGMDVIARRIASIRAFIAANEANLGKPRVLPRGEMDPGDPDFGPWYGEEMLTDSPQRPNALPATAGSEGAQHWPSIARWQLLGPFPLTRHDLVLPDLPDLAPCDDAPFIVEQERLADGHKRYKRPDAAGWLESAPNRVFGFLLPMRAGRVRGRGAWVRENARVPRDWGTGRIRSTYYARAEVYAEDPVELWAGFSIVERGQIWVNGSPVWVGPDRPLPWSMDNPKLIKIAFRKGINTVLLRLDVDDASSSCWMRICVQGRPRSPDEVKASQEAIAKARATMPPSGQEGRGWLGDGTGVYPGTHPPVAWDIKKKANVLWHKPLPYWGNASPCMASDRMFVTMEPMTLVCLAKDDGRILWERQASTIDLMAEDDRSKGWDLYRRWWAARQEVDGLPGTLRSFHGWIGRSWPWFWKEDRTPPQDERLGASKEMLALLDKRDELTKAEDPTAVQDQLNKVNGDIESLRKKETKASPDAEVRKRAARAWREVLTHMRKNSKVTRQDGYWQDLDGYAFCTPVTDGKHVWWKNGTGAVACFDMEGNRKWLFPTKGAGHGCASISSLLLVEDKLILWLPRRDMSLVALDADTGKEVWEATPIRGAGWNASTPAAVRITNGREQMTVIAMAGGTMVRADDGKILAKDAGVEAPEGAIVPWHDQVHLGYTSKQVLRLIMADRDHVGFQRQWCLDLPSDNCNYMGVFHAGEYACRVARGMPGLSGTCAALFEPRTGRVVDSIQLSGPASNGGNVWSLFAVSDDNVYAVYGDHMFNTGNGPPMFCTVFPPKPGMAVLARNAVDRMYGAPIIDGDRIYMRGYFGVYCIGYTGDAGRAYEARTVADTLLDAIPADAPADPPKAPLTVKAQPWEAARGVTWTPSDGTAGATWLFAGPFAADKGDKIVGSLGGPGARVTAGAKASDGTDDRVFCPLARGKVAGEDFWPWEVNDDLTLRTRDRRTFDLDRLIRGKRPCLVYMYCELSIQGSGARKMRLELTPRNSRAWLAGKPVANGDRVDLQPGTYPFLVEVAAGPERGALLFSPRWWNDEDPKAERKRWVDFVSRYRSWFEKAIELAPESDEAKRSRAVIDQLR